MDEITIEEIRKNAEEFRETGNQIIDFLESKDIDPFKALLCSCPSW